MVSLVLQVSLLAFAIAGAAAQADSCPEAAPAAGAALQRTIEIRGTGGLRIDLPPLRPPVVIRVDEIGIDTTFEVLDSKQVVLARAASPVRRTGTQLARVARGTPKTLVIRSIEHASHRGAATVIVRSAANTEPCASLERALAAADMRYAAARAAKLAAKPGDAPVATIVADAERLYQHAAALPGLSAAQQGTLELALANVTYHDSRKWQASADWSIRARDHFKSSGDAYASARARAHLAAAWLEIATASMAGGSGSGVPADSRARFDSARTLLKELEQFHVRRGEDYDAALQTNNIGLAYYYEARFAEAIPAYTASMRVFDRLGESPRVALAIQNIALCEWGQGRLTAALPKFDRALALMDPKARPNLYLLTLNSSALAHYAAGKYDESLRLNTRALEYAEQLQDDYYRGSSLMGLGITYYAIGDRKLAGQFLRSALDILTEELDGRGRATTLRSLAIIEHDSKRFAQAVQYNTDALRFTVAASARARIKVRLGADYAALGDNVRAKAELESVERDPPGGDALTRAEARLELGRLLHNTGNHAAAERTLNNALAGFESMQSVAGEFDSRIEIARVQVATRRESAAVSTLRNALQLSDEIETQTGNPEYRASVAQSLRPAQELMVDLQYARYSRARSAGDSDTAQQVANEALAFVDGTRAQVFGQILAQRFRREDPAFAAVLAERETLLRDLADRRYYLSTREDRKEPDDALAKSLRLEIAALRAQLGVKNSALAQLARNTSETDGAGAAKSVALARPAANRIFVEYWLGADNSYAWVMTHRELRWIKLRGGNEISQAARNLHESMRRVAAGQDSPTDRWARRRMLAQLHGLLITPLGPLQGIDELVVAADGPLHVVPFAALRGAAADARYLVADLAIALVPALRYAPPEQSAKDLTRSKARLLLVDDPVYQTSDSRLSQARKGRALTSMAPFKWRGVEDVSKLERLTSSAREAAAVRSAFTSRFGAAGVDLLEGVDATREALLAKDLSGYRYIHIASHGTIDTEIPQLSALVLGKIGRTGPIADQRVWVDDLLAQTFNAEVVVLSACNTALGAEFAGEGPIGLRYAVLARGAGSVVASLWPVVDEITASLMTEMYGELINQESRSEVALMLAMRRLLSKYPNLDPAFWSPYTVYLAQPQRR